MKMKSQHLNVVKMLAYSGAPKREVARTANISEQTLYNWIKDDDFARLHEAYTSRYQKAVEEYQLTSNYEQFLLDLEISKNDKDIVSCLAYIDANITGIIENKTSRIDNILEKCISLIEKRIDSETADDELLIYLLDRYLKNFNK
ncbi:MAG: hypothetical protein A2015_12130 [Spirochaetes bacterium GWF1_31_7]|nr:MAG: hypothetical protein A2Y30_14945 [Spirochaetes bacterium GWE1_32_154]OHD49164.1 MAG: hypothetical protein A2015_12130 [Spirochaetes bacterium GWF1_31_7]OHD50251.1 MAG: hypothetical protein A2Y29_12995 [Spirochaetes bacterium GWE2_31_10]OHD76609.1 MAG: hypothetical protein A2355_13560 [Spirochaetes bacterium RIFOXYB1_FULL_32_8]HBD93966.1 hypothetical protein [Spirochaetia bacterium]